PTRTRAFTSPRCSVRLTPSQIFEGVLLAFSCKGRYFCPSCHQKRVLMFGEWITGKILYPLPHRQYVFTLPKMLRVYFRFDRKLLGKLSQCAYQSLKEFFQTTLNRKKAKPGVVVSIQT